MIMLLTEHDKTQIINRGMTEEQVLNQLEQLSSGFPYLKLKAAATIGQGILSIQNSDKEHYQKIWRDYKNSGKNRILKFVPASGAASRMFKDLFAFIEADYDVPTTDYEKEFFGNISKFALYEELDAADRKSTRLNSSHANISYAVFCLKKKKYIKHYPTTTSYINCLRLANV